MELDIDKQTLTDIAEIVHETCGIVFRDSNLTVLVSRLKSKLKEKKVSAHAYHKLLKDDKNELMSFIDFVTTNFTSFFRNQRHFTLLEEEILPQLVKSLKDKKRLRIWSAGASTGEEAYTIAIIVNEYFEKMKIPINDWDIRIIGSDISLESLFIAQAAKYPARSVQKIDKVLFEKYFTPIEEGKFYIVREDIKKMVRFDFHNLIYDSIVKGIDITFCRNVLIYFDEDIQLKVVSKLHDAMMPESYLFIGHSESLVGLYDGFKAQAFEKGIVYVKQ